MLVGGLGWERSITSCLQGLKTGAFVNRSLEDEKTFRQGRHHVEMVLNQVAMFDLAFEYVDAFLKGGNHQPLSTRWYWGAVAASASAAFITSSQVKVWRLSEIANLIEGQSTNLSLLILTTATIGLIAIGETTLVVTTVAYLTLGIVERSNFLPLSIQNFVRQGGFFIQTFTGIYFGGNFIRVLSVLDLVTKIAKNFEFSPAFTKYDKPKLKEQAVRASLEVSEEAFEQKETISYQELSRFSQFVKCPLAKSHIHRNPLPNVDPSVKISDILDLANQLDWSKHESIIMKRLAKDKRWVEVEQHHWEPLAYFKNSLRNMVESIQNNNILTGKPTSYEMLEFYCRFIAQELKKEDEITQADILIWLGVDAGEYCGSGIFGVVEEIYGNLLLKARDLPLETRVLACLQQERVRVWQSIYVYMWNSTPFNRFVGYMLGVDAVHTSNRYMNIFHAGKKFGIPHQAAANDEVAIIPPFFDYIFSRIDSEIDEEFWHQAPHSTSHFEFGIADKKEWWKAWKWVHLKEKEISLQPYDEKAILERLSTTIGTPQIPKMDIYGWWRDWIERQDITEEKKEDLIDELGQTPGPGGLVTLSGGCFELDGKIQPKFLKIMLIEMGILKKPVF